MRYKTLLMTAACLFFMKTASAQTVYVDDVNMSVGNQGTITVSLRGVSPCLASGFSLVLPNGAFENYEVKVGEHFSNGHVALSCLQNNTTLKVAIYSPYNMVFNGEWVTDGSGQSSTSNVLLKVTFKSSSLPSGTYTGRVKNVELAYVGNQLARLSDTSFTVFVKDVATSIDEVQREPYKDDAWYDLSGRKYTEKPTSKGIYIRNGKKIVVK